MASFQNRIRIWEDTKRQSHNFFSTVKQSVKHSYENLPEPYLNKKFEFHTEVLVWKMNHVDATLYAMDKLDSVFPVLLNITNPNLPGNDIELGGV